MKHKQLLHLTDSLLRRRRLLLSPLPSSVLSLQVTRRDYHDACNNISGTIPYLGKGVKVGQYVTMERIYSNDDVSKFSSLIQDFNPLHCSLSSSEVDADNNNIRNNNLEENLLQSEQQKMRDAHEAAGLVEYYEENNSENERRSLVHGMYVSSIFSSLFANLAPGCVYVNQTLDFIKPIFVHDTVVGWIDIEKIRNYRRRSKDGGIVVQCRTRVYKIINSNNNNNNDNGSGKIKNNRHGKSKSCRRQQTNKQQRKLQQVFLLPPEAQLSVKGRAKVWLPIGYQLH